LTKPETLRAACFAGRDLRPVFHRRLAVRYFAEWDVRTRSTSTADANLAKLAIHAGVKKFTTEHRRRLRESKPPGPRTIRRPAESLPNPRWEQEKVLWDLHKNQNLPLTCRPAADLRAAGTATASTHSLRPAKDGTGGSSFGIRRNTRLISERTRARSRARRRCSWREKTDRRQAYNVLSTCHTTGPDDVSLSGARLPHMRLPVYGRFTSGAPDPRWTR